MIGITKHALMITSFVFVMMLLIEYINVLTGGRWQKRLANKVWGQYILASFLGIVPGCLGAFIVVAMYSHGILTLGAVVAAMVATSGDEAYVMLAMIPKQAFLITGVLFAVGIMAGILTDIFINRSAIGTAQCCEKLEVHDIESCNCFPRGMILQQWKECSPSRGILAFVLILFILAFFSGEVGPTTWDWVRITLLVVSSIALFIVVTVPDHFLMEHLWQHVVKKHVPQVFLWTLGALIVMYVLTEHFHLESTIREGKWIVLLVACLVGLIPESGPHLIFVTFYAQGTIPLSILLASSIVQDGHGMLPMLAHSKRSFLEIKIINFMIGFLCGAIGLIIGF